MYAGGLIATCDEDLIEWSPLLDLGISVSAALDF